MKMVRDFATGVRQTPRAAWLVIVVIQIVVLAAQVGAGSPVKYNSRNEPCLCVGYFLCHDNGTYDATAAAAIQPRGSFPDHTLCDDEWEFCCRLTSVQAEILKEMNISTEPDDAESTSKQPVPLQTTESEESVPVPFPVPVRKIGDGCGLQPVPIMPEQEGATDLPDKRRNGTIASYAEFPWMLLLLVEDVVTGQLTVKCGASLFLPQMALTAAHCLNGLDRGSFVVRAGDWDLFTSNEPRPWQDRRVRKIITHSNYLPDSFHNDIAILVLESRFDIVDNVDQICLPVQNLNVDRSRCIVTGWGKSTAGTYQRYLHKLELPVVPRLECETRLRRTRLGPLFSLDNSFLCAGGEPGLDVCEGYGGSPLICPFQSADNLDRWRLAGIVSWGVECGTTNPGVYVNVPKYTEWILEEASKFYRDARQAESAGNLDDIWFGIRALMGTVSTGTPGAQADAGPSRLVDNSTSPAATAAGHRAGSSASIFGFLTMLTFFFVF